MSMTYLDTFGAVIAAGEDGVAYATMTRAMKVHVRSLYTEGHVAAFSGDDAVDLSADGAVICLTADGETYADLLSEVGLMLDRASLQEQGPAKPRKRKTSRRRKTTSKVSERTTVPTPTESVESPVLPKGSTARRVPGNQHGDQLMLTDAATDEPSAPVQQIQQSVLEDMIAEAVAKALANV